MQYKFTRIIKKYGWDKDTTESRMFEIEDTYDPMDWDDLIDVIGYTVEGHKGEDVTIKIRAIEEEKHGTDTL